MVEQSLIGLIASVFMLAGSLVTGVTTLIAFRVGRRIGRRDTVISHHYSNRSTRHREPSE